MKFVFLLLLLSGPALAQAPQQMPQTLGPGPAHYCAMYYPPSAVRSHAEGVTTLEFQVTAAGAVTNVSVKKPSGHLSLDEASVKCVQQWQYLPIAKNGIGTESTKQVNIVWRLNEQSPLLFVIENAALDCIRQAQPGDEALAKATKNTVVQIQFRESESPSVEVTSPSGNEELDKMVVGCLNHLPPSIVVHTSMRLGFVIPFSWKTDVQARITSAPK